MQNINIKVSPDGKTATIVIDLTQRLGESSSQKSIIVASTGGNQTIPETEVVLGLNAYVRNQQANRSRR